MRRLHPHSEPYQVVFGPRAWLQLGRVPHDVYGKFRERLQQLAELAAQREGAVVQTGSQSAPGSDVAQCVTIEDYVVTFELDHQRRTVTLVDVARTLPQD